MSNEINTLNFTTGTRGVFLLPAVTETNFTIVKWNLPGIALPAATQPTPFRDMPVHGDKLEPESLALSFIVTEDLENWLEVYDWITELGAPEEKGIQYKDRRAETDGVFTIYNSHNNVIKRFRFVNCVITYLSSVDFSTMEGDTDIKYATMTFEYQKMVVDPVA